MANSDASTNPSGGDASARATHRALKQDEVKAINQDLLQALRTLINDGRYQPQAVRRVEIPKPDGGKRMLGIPTVMDRVIQQAIAQVLTPIFDPTFSVSSFGFRPGCNAHQAIR